ncbi:unnamed protein product [Heterobilharzia americana]|nr:unnamed protein product [Heterobilharzia americana]
MSETHLLNSTHESNIEFKSPHISTSWSCLPVKFTYCDLDHEKGEKNELDKNLHLSNHLASSEMPKSMLNQVENNTNNHPLSNSIDIDKMKSSLSSSFTSIPNYISSVEYSSDQQRNNESISEGLTPSTPTPTTTISGTYLRTSKASSSALSNVDDVQSIGVRSNSSWSTVQSHQNIKSTSSPPLSSLSSQNISKSSIGTRSSSKRFANFYTPIMPANHSITSPRSRLSPLSSSSKRSSPFKRRYPRNLLHIPLNGDWTDDIFWTLSNTTTNPSDMNNITNTITTTTSNTTKSSSNHNTTATCVTYKKSLPSRRRHKHRQSLTPSYRTKLDQFRRAFRGTPVDTDRLLVDYSCALSKNNNGLLLQGRMYITETWVCFYSKILYEQKIFLSVNEIVSITKEKTARVIPNAIQILYSKSHELWENCRNHQAMSIDEILQQIRDMYGDHSLAVVEDEDTDGDPDLPSNTYSHRLRTLSDSSICSQLTGGTCHSKSISLEDVWQSDQPMHIDQSSNDELKPVGSDGEMLMIHSAPHALSDSNQFNSINEDDHKRNKEMNTIRRCLTPELIYPITQLSSTVSSTASSASSSSRLLNIPDEILSDSIHTTNNNNSSRTGKEKKKRIRKRRHHQHHHSDEISSNTRLADTCQHNIMKPIMNTTIDITSSTPVYCSPRHDHPGRVYIDTDISMNVNALFNCIFTDSEFFHV